MRRLFWAHCKRFARYLPGAVCSMVALAVGLLVLVTALTGQAEQEARPLKVGMVGTAENTFLQMGMNLLQESDASRFSMEFIEYSEADARAALGLGQLDAYVVIPEGFAEDALSGNIRPLDFVTTTAGADLTVMLKEEITGVISRLLLESQRGVYGLQSAMKAEALSGRSQKMTALALRYTDYVLTRDQVYRLESLGIHQGLSLQEYLLCGICVVLLSLSCLPFGPLLLGRKPSAERMLAARGRPAWLQAVSELAAYWLALWLVSLLLLPALGAFPAPWLWLGPVTLTVAAFSYWLTCLANDPVSGTLLQFFVGLMLCFVSGCLYPAWFFPVSVQRLAAILPASLARDLLSGNLGALLPLLGWAAAFAALGIWQKCRAIREASL